MSTPVFTGLHELDELTGGFKPGELILLGARPAMGKTSFALNLLENVGIKGNMPCLMLSLETGEEHLMRHLYALHTGITPFHKGKAADMEVFREQYMEKGPMWIEAKPVHDLDELMKRLRILSAAHELKFIVVDYLQLLAGPASMDACLSLFKALARELSVPIIILSQINQLPDSRADKRPIISDLRWVSDTGPVDQVLFLYRDDYYNRDSEQYNVAEFILARHPEGRSGTARALFRYTPLSFLVYSDYKQTKPPRSRGNGKPLVVGRTKRGAEISICDHCEAYPDPHFNFAYGEDNEEAQYFEKPMLLDSIGNLDLTTRMDLQDFLTPERWERMISLWNENNEQQLSPYTHIPYYINLRQYQDMAITTTQKERTELGATLYIMEDQDQRPHFHYERQDGSVTCISLTDAEYLPPVQKPLSEQELDRLMNCLDLVDDRFGLSLYQRLLMLWNKQNRTLVDEDQDMPNYWLLRE